MDIEISDVPLNSSIVEKNYFLKMYGLELLFDHCSCDRFNIDSMMGITLKLL